MQTLYQSLVAVEPLTLIVTILNLFVQMYIVKRFFLDKILGVLDARREAADRELTQAQEAKKAAVAIQQTYEENMRTARQQAGEILDHAKKTAQERSDAILQQAQQEAAQMRVKAEADIARERKKAMNEAKDEISQLAMEIAEKVVTVRLQPADQAALVDKFIDELGDAL